MVLTDLGITYITINVPREKTSRKRLFSVSGQNGIPTLVDGDVIISDDDDAIIAYLKKRYAQAPKRFTQFAAEVSV